MATLLVDYMYAAGQSPASIKSFGYVGVMRYLAPLPNSKVMTKAEAFALHSAGLAIGLVWEWTNNRAGAGAAAGTVDAQRAEAQADALGYPSDCPIFYAIDYDVGGPAVAPYFQGIALAARRPVGAYGPRPAVDWMIANGLAVYGWQAAGWVHGADSQVAHLKQLVGGALIPNTDANILLKPFPMWGLGDELMGATEDVAECKRMLAVLLKGAQPGTDSERQVMAQFDGIAENAAESRRQGGVLLGVGKPAGSEKTIPAQVGQATVDVAALAAALAADQAFVDRLAAAVTARKYVGTLEPMQP